VAYCLTLFNLASCFRQRSQKGRVAFARVPFQVVVVERRDQNQGMSIAEDEHIFLASLPQYVV
jgi:hypothetical protein